MRGIFAVLLIGGCQRPLTALDPDTLTDRGGCGDTIVYAVDAAHEVMLIVNADEGLVAAAIEAGTPQQASFELPDPDIEVRLDQGTAVDDATCDDVVMNGGPDVFATWSATAGLLAFEVTPEDDGARADVTLSNATLSGDAGELAVDEVRWTGIYVGWLAG